MAAPNGRLALSGFAVVGHGVSLLGARSGGFIYTTEYFSAIAREWEVADGNV